MNFLYLETQKVKIKFSMGKLYGKEEKRNFDLFLLLAFWDIDKVYIIFIGC